MFIQDDKVKSFDVTACVPNVLRCKTASFIEFLLNCYSKIDEGLYELSSSFANIMMKHFQLESVIRARFILYSFNRTSVKLKSGFMRGV